MWMNFLNLTSEIAVRCVLAGWSKLSVKLCTSPPSLQVVGTIYTCCARNLGVWLKKQISCRREAKVNPVKQLYSLNLFSSLKWKNSVRLWTEAAFNAKKEGIDTETRRTNIQWTELLTRLHDARKYKISLLHGPLSVIPIEQGDEIAINPLNSNLK